jgi:dipeptidyl aminopeptidase/acylaminoacyl peptidase
MSRETDPQVGREVYERAARFLPWNIADLVFDGHVQPHWIEQSDRFWYRIRRPSGTAFVLVDPERDLQEPAFDHAQLAAALSRASGTAYDPTALPFEEIEFVEGEGAVRFTVGETTWECTLESYDCRQVEGKAEAEPGGLASPDGKRVALTRDHNVFVRSRETGEERQLTTDGEQWYAYGSKPDGRGTNVADVLLERKNPPVALWSPDSRKLVTSRLDERMIPELYVQQTVLPEGSYRPILHRYRYAQVGDEHIAMAELVVIDVESGTVLRVDYEPIPSSYMSPLELRRVWWDADSANVYFIHEERNHRTLHLVAVDVGTGQARTLLTESGTTVIDVAPTPFIEAPSVRIIGKGLEFIWYSTRDGWGHLYLYDGASGELKTRLTSGPWVVHEIVHVDEDGRWVYFLAGGKEERQDPYRRHLYRVRLEGSDLELLTPEDLDHAVTFSPSGRYFVDSASRVDAVPGSILCSADGRVIRRLEEGDVTMLQALGWRFPEPFSVKARDGMTDLYGLIVRPSTFDPTKTYPVIDSIYPGPQILRTPRRFLGSQGELGLGQFLFWHDQAMAELGFIVVTIDGQGTPYRSKAFMDVAAGERFGEAGGLADHVAGLRQLGARDSSLDLSRVGIYGHSGGGYASARAILQFPEFYKVAVSSAGNHDQHGYLSDWGERYIGLVDGDNYRDQANYHLAKNLRGKLLLVYGQLDDNVPPALTLQLVDALIRANKDFDLLVLPHCDHAFIDFREGREKYESLSRRRTHPYFVRRRWDYFVRHLLGMSPAEGFALS